MHILFCFFKLKKNKTKNLICIYNYLINGLYVMNSQFANYSISWHWIKSENIATYDLLYTRFLISALS